MNETQITLVFIWVSLMLVYFLGDILRIFAGDFKPGEIEGKKTKPWMWTLISVIMVIPIFMILLTLKLDYPINRIVNIVAAGFYFVFNLIGLPGYPSFYDKFLIVVGLGFNLLTIWYAWNWV